MRNVTGCGFNPVFEFAIQAIISEDIMLEFAGSNGFQFDMLV